MSSPLYAFRTMCCALFSLALIIGCSPQTPPIKLNTDSVILAFGDSLTLGVGAKEWASYPAVLEQELGVKVVNAGVSGEVSSDGLARLKPLLNKYSPSVVVICHGGNDMLRKLSKLEMQRHVSEMVALASDSGAYVIVVAVPEPRLFLSPDPLYREIADSYGVVLVESVLSELLSQPEMKSDAVHLNSRGYTVLANHIASLITVD